MKAPTAQDLIPPYIASEPIRCYHCKRGFIMNHRTRIVTSSMPCIRCGKVISAYHKVTDPLLNDPPF